LVLHQLVDVLTLGLKCIDLFESITVRHQRFDRYKFFEFQILNVVLGELVDVELVEIGQEAILRWSLLLDRLSLSILRVHGLALVLEAGLHESHLAKGRAGSTERACNLELVDDLLHLPLELLGVRGGLLLLLIMVASGLSRLLRSRVILFFIGTSLLLLFVNLISVGLGHLVNLEDAVEGVASAS